MSMMESFSRVAALRDSLIESQAIASGAKIVLQGYSNQLESLISSVEQVADRAQSLTNAQKRVDHALKGASTLLQHLDTPGRVETKIKQGPRASLSEFLAATARLDECNRFLASHRGMQAAEKSLRLGQILQKEAITLSLDEFEGSLKRAARVIDLKLVKADADAFKTEALNKPQDILTTETVDKLKRLHEILKKMGDSSSIKAFHEIRASVMDKSMLASLDAKLLTPEEFNKLSWHAAEGRIRVWISIILGMCGQLAVEQRLACQIFGRQEGMEAYQGIMNPVVHHLYTRFISKILGSKAIPEKIYGLLEAGEKLHAGLVNLHLDSTSTSNVLGDHFAAQAGTGDFRNKGQINLELAECARSTYAVYRASLRLESPRQTVGVASVHALTAQVMTLCKRLSRYTSCPAILFGTQPFERLPFARVTNGGRPQDDLMQSGLEKLLDLLWDTLMGIASSCKNEAMACIFLTTNAHYIVKTIQHTETLHVVSPEWQTQCEAKLEEYGGKYQELAWGPIISIINDSNRTEIRGLNWLKEKTQLKEKWKKINNCISVLISEQRLWSISDASLRTNLRNAILEDFIPIYREFWEEHQNVKFTSHPGRYLRYSPEALTEMIKREIFQSESSVVSSDVSSHPGGQDGSCGDRFCTNEHSRHGHSNRGHSHRGLSNQNQGLEGRILE